MYENEYKFCVDNSASINQGSNEELKSYCSNVVSVYLSANPDLIASLQQYSCQAGYVGMKMFSKKSTLVIMYVTNRHNISTAYVPAITVCNQNL